MNLKFVKFEKSESTTPTHILLALILLATLANHSQLADLQTTMTDVSNDVVDVQNNATDNKDEIKSSLDDVVSAIQANQ